MFDRIHPKRGMHFFTFSGLLLAMATLLVCSFPMASLAEETAKAPVKAEETPAAAASAPCQGLKPFNNLDELLYQFYINLDRDCLFEMPVEELEKIWGIRILDEELAKPQNYYPLSETEFYNKPYKSEKDAFYLERIHGTDFNEGDIFIINATKEYSEKHEKGFWGEKLPEMLPKPDSYSEVFIGPPSCNYKDFFYFITLHRQEKSKKQNSSDFKGKIPESQKTDSEYDKFKFKSHQKAVCYNWINRPNRYTRILLVSPTKATITRPTRRTNKEKENILKQRALALSKAKESAPSGSDIKATPCKGLKAVNNIDELLYQLYINSDSDCLAKKTVEEMEAIWGIKIFSSKKMLGNFLGPVQAGEGLRIIDAMKKKPDFYNKPYKSEEDAFVVERNNSKNPREYLSMKIEIADEYYKKHTTLFPGGNFPKMLPYPSIKLTDLGGWRNHFAFHHLGTAGSEELIPENNSEYVLDLFTYSWFNSGSARVIQVKGNWHGKVIAIDIYSPGSAADE